MGKIVELGKDYSLDFSLILDHAILDLTVQTHFI